MIYSPDQHSGQYDRAMRQRKKKVLYSLQSKLEEINTFPTTILILYGLPDIASVQEILPLAQDVEAEIQESGWYARVTPVGSEPLYCGSTSKTLPKLYVEISKTPLEVNLPEVFNVGSPPSLWQRIKLAFDRIVS